MADCQTDPRSFRIIEGVDLFITRRVRGREYRLRPSKKTNQVVGYIVAVIAKKYNISIHAICVLSDHWHVVIHDWRAGATASATPAPS